MKRAIIAIVLAVLLGIAASAGALPFVEPDGPSAPRSMHVTVFGDLNYASNNAVGPRTDNVMWAMHDILSADNQTSYDLCFGLGDYNKSACTYGSAYDSFVGVLDDYFGTTEALMVPGDNEDLWFDASPDDGDWDNDNDASSGDADDELEQWDEHIGNVYDCNATAYDQIANGSSPADPAARWWYEDVKIESYLVARVIGLTTQNWETSTAEYDGCIGYAGYGSANNSEQGDFLDEALDSCEQPATIIVVMHSSPAWLDANSNYAHTYSSPITEPGFGKTNRPYYTDYDGTTVGEEMEELLETFARFGVDLVVCGDTHVFRKTVMNGSYNGSTRSITFLQVPPAGGDSRVVDTDQSDNVPQPVSGESCPANYYPDATAGAQAGGGFFLDLWLYRGGLSTNYYSLHRADNADPVTSTTYSVVNYNSTNIGGSIAPNSAIP